MADNFVIGIGGNTTDVSIGNTATSNTFVGKLVGNASSADKVNNSLTIGDYVYDGSKAITISKDTFSSEDKQTRTDLLEYEDEYMASYPESSYVPYYNEDTGENARCSIGMLAQMGLQEQAKTNGGLTGILSIKQGITTTINAVPIAQGGTGATTASGARTNLEITPANIGALSLTGGTMTGAIKSTANDNYPLNCVRAGAVGLRVQNTSANKIASLEASSSYTGIYMGHVGKWLINHDGSNVNIMGNPYHQTYYGTTSPDASLGVNGDIYIKYNA